MRLLLLMYIDIDIDAIAAVVAVNIFRYSFNASSEVLMPETLRHFL